MANPTMDAHPFVAHILSQTRQNVEFLIAQNQISANDGRDILAKLSAGAAVARTSSPPTTVLFRAKAVWGYNEQGQDQNDLSFNAGEIIDITAETNSDWWTGRHRDKIGLFPSNYVERLSAPPPSAPPPSAPSLPSPVSTPYAPPYGGPEKASLYPIAPLNHYPSYQPPGGYQPPPPGGVYNPYGGPAQPPPPPPNTVVAATSEQPQPQPPKKSKFGGKLGSTLAHSAAGGVGFGAGSAVGSGIINSIF